MASQAAIESLTKISDFELMDCSKKTNKKIILFLHCFFFKELKKLILFSLIPAFNVLAIFGPFK